MCYAFSTMFDWYIGLIGYDASALDTGSVQVIEPGGNIQKSYDRWMEVEGSYSSRIRIKPAPCTVEMLIKAKKFNLHIPPETVYKVSGNPTKWLQGHNVFGASVSFLGSTVRAWMRDLPELVRPPDVDDDLWPSVHRTRVDVTTSIRLDNHEQVHEWLEHARRETRSKHKRHIESFEQSGMTGAGTVIYGKSSKRWQMEFYCKYCELAIHQPKDEKLYNKLRLYADGLLRAELRLFRLELKDRGTLDESLVWEFFDKIEVGVMKDDIEKSVASLRPREKMVYQLWRDGHDVSPASGLLPRSTWYLFRKEILAATGEDISNSPAQKKSAAGARKLFNTDHLKAHEVTEVPAELQEHLFKPEKIRRWPAH